MVWSSEVRPGTLPVMISAMFTMFVRSILPSCTRSVKAQPMMPILG